MAHAVLSEPQRPSVNLSIRPTSPEAVSTSMVRPLAFVGVGSDLAFRARAAKREI
jgi:hypothetical protein